MSRMNSQTRINSIIASLICILIGSTAFSQNIGVANTTITPDAQAILELRSTDKGVLLPRMTTTQANTLATSLDAADDGMTVYDITTKQFKYWDGSTLTWRILATNATVTSSTLDDAYDAGGAGAGRTITGDAGAVVISGTGGADALTTDGNVRIGLTSGTNNDLYLSDDLIDWDNQSYFIDPGSDSRMNQIEFDNGSIGNPTVWFEGDNNSGLYQPADGIVAVTINGSEAMRINAGRDMGIGTTSPNARLEVQEASGGSPFVTRITKESNAANELIGIGFGAQVGQHFAKSAVVHERLSANGTGKLHFLVDDATDANDVALAQSRMTIDPAGDVGIGTTDPLQKLHVVGTTRISTLAGSGNRMVVANANGDLTTQTIPANGDITGVTAGDGLTGGGTSGSVTLNVVATNGLTDNANDVRLGGTLIQPTTITAGTNNMDINLNSSGDFRVMDGGTTRVRFEDGGRVEILGTTDASGTAGSGILEIGNAMRFDNNEIIMNTDAQLLINHDNNGDVRIDNTTFMVDASANRVGIGLTAPSQTLEVNGHMAFSGGDRRIYVETGYLDIRPGDGTHGLIIRDFDGAGTAWSGIRTQDNGAMELGSDGGGYDQLVLADNGFVGMSTNAPSTTLDVNGTIRVRGGTPAVGDVLTATSTNGTATWSAGVPKGTIVAWHKNGGGGTLPAGWRECNSGVGTVNGVAVPNLNGGTTSKSGDASRGRFLRGNTTSGLFQGDESNGLRDVNQSASNSGTGSGTVGIDDDGNYSGWLKNYYWDDRLRFRHQGVETRVTNMSVVWIIKVD